MIFLQVNFVLQSMNTNPSLELENHSGGFELILAEHLGLCFGVRDAIELARQEGSKGPLTILGSLAHHPHIVEDLESRGIRTLSNPEGLAWGERVMITAHGASDRRIQDLKAQGHEVLEATCPLVRQAHQALRQMIQEGRHPVIIGIRDHVEVRGMTEDLEHYDVVLTEKEIDTLPFHPRIGVVAQTTQPTLRVEALTERLQRRHPNADVRLINTVCRPTRQRQEAADQLARRCDVIIVVGGPNSNNTRELVASCGRYGAQVHRVTEASELQASWFDRAARVGLTAGTSAPDAIVAGVLSRLQSWSRPLPVSTQASNLLQS